jgi:hypothetical protein
LANNFTTGEVSPKLGARYDLTVYQNGVSRLENFMPMIQGGVTRRPGTKSVGPSLGARLIPFILSTDAAYIVELGDGSIRIWYNDELVEFSVNGQNVTQFGSPYPASIVPYLQYCQDATNLYIVHRNYPPKVLSLVGGGFAFQNFVPSLALKLADGKVVEGDFDDVNEDMLILPMEYPGCVAYCSNRLWFASSHNHPYRLWASRPFEPTNFEMYDIVTVTDEVQTSQQYMLTIQFEGKEVWDLKVSGTATINNFITLTIRGITEHIAIVTGDTADAIAIKIAAVAWPASWVATAAGPNTRFVASEAGEKTGTSSFSLSSPDSSLSFTQECLIAGYTEGNEPTTTVTTNKKVYRADNAMMLEVGSNRNDRIEWLVAHNNILVGTASGEWIMPGNIDALSPSIVMQTAYGSAPLQAQAALGDLFFLQSGGKRLRAYIPQSGAYSCMDLTFTADHILKAGVKEMHWQRVPEPRLYCLLKDGAIAVLAYDRLYGMQAWSRWTFGDAEVLSLAIIDTSQGQDVYALIERGTGKYLEMFDEGSQVFSDRHDTATPVVFDSTITTNRYETSSNNGSTIGKSKRITKATFRLIDSGRFTAGYNGRQESQLPVTEGDVSLNMGGGYEKELRFTVQSCGSEPLTILGMVFDMEVV